MDAGSNVTTVPAISDRTSRLSRSRDSILESDTEKDLGLKAILTRYGRNGRSLSGGNPHSFLTSPA